MQVIESPEQMQSTAVGLRSGGKLIGFVPTMGALHEGHLSLVDLAQTQADTVVASIFVNPTQFGPSEDFDQYPRDHEADLQKCEDRGVDIVFAPTKVALYPQGYSTYIVEEALSGTLCGVSRPQFFRGVCTVVAKLFNIVRPDIAVFGQKDAQQAAVLQRMVRDLHFPVEILVGPTVREPDGLALSSRNRYLNAGQRKSALRLHESLQKAGEMVRTGTLSTDRIVAEITHHLTSDRRLRPIYISVVDRETLKPLKEAVPGRTLIALAVWCDEVRLIDNVLL